MGQIKILEKLTKELEKDITEECQVVYILSRIRKSLEINNQQGKYKYLNFYCNWALHAKLDRTESFGHILRDFTKLNDDKARFITFEHLLSDLKTFFSNNNIPQNILDKNWINFRNLLVDIYSDTPLVFYPEGRKQLTIHKPEKTPIEGEFAVAFKIMDYPN